MKSVVNLFRSVRPAPARALLAVLVGAAFVVADRGRVTDSPGLAPAAPEARRDLTGPDSGELEARGLEHTKVVPAPLTPRFASVAVEQATAPIPKVVPQIPAEPESVERTRPEAERTKKRRRRRPRGYEAHVRRGERLVVEASLDRQLLRTELEASPERARDMIGKKLEDLDLQGVAFCQDISLRYGERLVGRRYETLRMAVTAVVLACRSLDSTLVGFGGKGGLAARAERTCNRLVSS